MLYRSISSYEFIIKWKQTTLSMFEMVCYPFIFYPNTEFIVQILLEHFYDFHFIRTFFFINNDIIVGEAASHFIYVFLFNFNEIK